MRNSSLILVPDPGLNALGKSNILSGEILIVIESMAGQPNSVVAVTKYWVVTGGVAIGF